MASGNLDSWQSLHETCQKLEHELTSSLSSSRGSSYHAQTQWRDKVQESLGRFTLAVLSLRQKLNTSGSSLTIGERRRREGLVNSLEGREKQLRMVFQQQQSGGSSAKRRSNEGDERKRLLDSAIIDVGTDNRWTNREDEPLLPSAGNSDMLGSYHQSRDQILAEQDRGLDALHEVILRQKYLSENIQREAVAHHDIIDDINQGIEHTNERLLTTTQTVRSVGQRDSVWRYWLTIFLLAIVIIIIIAVPGNK